MLLPLVVILLLASMIWSVILTYLFLQMKKHYSHLTQDAKGRNLLEILNQILTNESEMKKDIASLTTRCDKIEQEQVFALKKVGLIRFNPFKDTGGDQSFIIALLNREDTGVVISGLYSRLGTRWYAKQVKRGEAVDHDLSSEEKKAIASATHT